MRKTLRINGGNEIGKTVEKSLDEYFWHAAEQDIEAAVAVSPSFRMFVEELRQWHRPQAN